MAVAIPAAIQAERDRQISGEGYDATHDDGHDDGELLAVARMYWQVAIGVALPMRGRPGNLRMVPIGFPWAPEWWKPKSKARDLERAGALCLAEIDRLKRKGRNVEHVEEQLGLIVQAYETLP